MIYTVCGGFFMALADSVPGVSGGTIAFIMGFYDAFINSLAALVHGKKEDKIAALRFLAKLGAGWIIGMGLAVALLASVFTNSIYQISSLFLGFVLVSIPLILREEKDALAGRAKHLLFSFLGAAVVILLSVCNLSGMVHHLGASPLTAAYVLLAGVLAISAMVLPGISGSTLLMSFGLYVPIITAAKEVFSFQFHNLWMLIFFGCGILAGVIFSLRGIKKLLDSHRSAVVYAILGMLVGSLYAICMGPTTLQVPRPMMSLSQFHPLWFIAGVAVMLGLTLFKSWMKAQKDFAQTPPPAPAGTEESL